MNRKEALEALAFDDDYTDVINQLKSDVLIAIVEKDIKKLLELRGYANYLIAENCEDKDEEFGWKDAIEFFVVELKKEKN